MDERALYHETCRYVDRVQETLNQTLSAEEWDRLVHKIMDEMSFLVRRPNSASGDTTS